MIFPTRDDIVRTNRRHIETTGGFYIEPENLANPGSLGWVLDAIQYPPLSFDPYPTLSEKAARLAWTIIKGHIFYDGNKRTGMSVLQTMIRLNGLELKATEEEIVAVALGIAGGSETATEYEEFVKWVRDRIAIRTTSFELLE